MSTRRLAAIAEIPDTIKRAFRNAEEPFTQEEQLWRERAARMTLDALGYTNLTIKPWDHNEVVRYARRWFRQMYAYSDDPKKVDNAEATFDFAGIMFKSVRDAVLKMNPKLIEDDDSWPIYLQENP